MTRERWRSLVRGEGAAFGAGADAPVESFGSPEDELRTALEDGPRIADLSHRARLVVEGDDAGSFLQNQVTGDLGRAAEGQAMLTGIAQAGGRLIALFRLLPVDGAWWLVCRADAADALRERLVQMKLRARVGIGEPREDLGLIAIAGLDERSAPVAEALPPGVSVAPLLESPSGNAALAAGPWEGLAVLWERLRTACRPVGWPAWRLGEIAAGIPDLPGALAGRFLPQFLDLERLGGLSFSKGCFPGQEVIARTHYLGRTVRRLTCAETTGTPPAPGTPIRAAGSEAGVVLDAAPLPSGGALVQAVVRVEVLEAGRTLFLGGDDGPPLVLRGDSPPFAE